MIKSKNSLFLKVGSIVVVIYSLFLLSNMLLKHYEVINHPYQLDYREVANMLDTKAILAGENPYALKNSPNYGTCYGIGYSFTSVPFAKLFGLNLFSHRLLSILSLLISATLFFFLLRKEKIDIWLSLSGAIILYFNISFNNQALCRPDALAMLFFSLSVFLPIYYNYSNKSLLIALFCSIFAFYTKQYFILGFPIILGYVFLFKSMKKSVIYGALFLTLLVLSYILAKYFLECYFYSTTISMAYLALYEFNYAVMQFEQFFIGHLGFTFLFIISLIILTITQSTFIKSRLSNFTFLSNVEEQFNLKEKSKGLLKFNIDVYLVFFILIGLVLLLKLGGNNGAFMAYYFQLLSFCFIALVLRFTVIFPNSKLLFVPFVLFNLYSANFADSTPMITNEERKDWAKVRQIVKKGKDVLNTPAIAYELFLNKKHIYDNGLNCPWLHYKCDPNTIPGRMIKNADSVIANVQNKIKNQKFDYLIMDIENKWTHYSWFDIDSLREKYYVKKDTLFLKMFQTNQNWPVNIWVPKK